MVCDKLFYKTILKSMFTDPFEIKFWDGIVDKFGEGESKFQIIFNEPISKKDIINDPSITFGEAYMTKKLEHWAENFESVLPIVEKTKDETFIRMWRLYLNSCAASFNCGNINLHQILFAKGVN
nr:class I SAM-dependent methyltransferase [Clostridium estertheticum]